MEKHKDLEKVVEELGEGEQFLLESLKTGRKLEVKTKNTLYIIEHREDGFYISGNEKYCPNPTKTEISGSTSGGTAVNSGKVVVGGHLEFWLPERQGPMTTSQIEEFRELD